MRTLLASVLALGALTLLAPVEPQAAAATVAAAPEPTARHDLSGDAVAPDVQPGAMRARIRTWPGSTIRYHESIPAKWDWSLDQAVQHWNEAGGGIRFVETSRARARLRIGYGDTGGADGVGTLGYQRTNYVHLSPAYKRADELDPEIRVWVGRLFTHELGHVLGFDHTRGQCSLMYPVYDFGLCPPLSDTDPGYYHCRWIDKPLLRRFVALYGGRAQRPPPLCLIEALPEPLRDVRFAGGAAEDAPVTITWQPQRRARPGTKVWVTVWSATSCEKQPDTWERRQGVDPAAGAWTDPRHGQGAWCYAVQIVNRYGAGRPADVQRIARWAPVPDAPEPGEPTWLADQGAWRFTWAAPDGTALAVVHNAADPATCPTGTDDWSDLERAGTDRWILRPYAPEECVLLVATTDWGTVSTGTPVHLSVPGVGDAPAVGTPVWVPAEGAFRVTWTPPDDLTHLELVRSDGDAAACPTAYDADRAELPWEDGRNTWLVPSYGPRECVTFFAVTAWGGVSPGTAVPLRQPVPDAPAPPAPEWLGETAQWRFTWTAPTATGLGVVRNWEDPATCPTGTDDWSLMEQSDAGHWLLGSNGPVECVLLVAYTDWGTVSAPTTVHLRVPGIAEAPVVGTPVWVPEEDAFRVTWTPPDASTHLEVVRSAAAGQCPGAYEDGYAEEPDRGGPGLWLVWANQARECVLLVAVSPAGASVGTRVSLEVPAPTAVPTVGAATRDPDTGEVVVRASLERGAYDLGLEVLPGRCPAGPPADAGWGDGYESAPGVWTLVAESAGEQCALFAAVDRFGQHGPVVPVSFGV